MPISGSRMENSNNAPPGNPGAPLSMIKSVIAMLVIRESVTGTSKIFAINKALMARVMHEPPGVTAHPNGRAME